MYWPFFLCNYEVFFSAKYLVKSKLKFWTAELCLTPSFQSIQKTIKHTHMRLFLSLKYKPITSSQCYKTYLSKEVSPKKWRLYQTNCCRAPTKLCRHREDCNTHIYLHKKSHCGLDYTTTLIMSKYKELRNHKSINWIVVIFCHAPVILHFKFSRTISI